MKRVGLWLVILALFVPALRAQETLSINDVSSGALLLKTAQPGRYLPALSVDSHVALKVTGPIVRATVTQSFRNDSNRCAEGIYVFPLPEGAAVDAMTLRVGDRRIEGILKEREDAKRVYEQARANGQRASLLEQMRPNVFTVSVANMLPNDDIAVEISYQELARWDEGAFHLRFPTVVAPRYTPKGAGDPAAAAAPAGRLGNNRWSIDAELTPGVPLQEVTSSYHDVDAVQESSDRWKVTLQKVAESADRDFELTWRPGLGSAPSDVLFTESVDGDTYGLLMVIPPAAGGAPRMPRDVIFIIDTSGSMEGESLEQARGALALALDRLTPGDRFNVIEFNSVTNPLFEGVVAADRNNIAQARRFVGELQATGGTEMMPALLLAMQQMKRTNAMMKQIVFITDGQVSNEAELFATIQTQLGDARLFTVAIGSAPNGHFMNGAARAGRGTFTYVGSANEISAKMESLLRKIETPALTGLALRGLSGEAQLAPRALPDVYAGEPVVVAFRERGALRSTLDVSAGAGSGIYKRSLTANAAAQSGVARVWGRMMIEALSDEALTSGDRAVQEKQITDIALRHRIVSERTSFVAVDVTPTSLGAASCVSTPIPLNAPAGSPAVGELPQTATTAPMLALLGVVLLALACVMRVS